MLRARGTTRNITPSELPIHLGGYANGTTATRVDSPLEVNCLVLTDGAETVVLVSLDLLYVTHALRGAVIRGLTDLGVGESNLFIGASHTHYAPAIDETKPALGLPNSEYRSEVADAIIDAIRDALTGPQSLVSIESAASPTSIGVNRRRRRLLRVLRGGIEFNHVAMCPNPSGPTDPIASVVSVRAQTRALAYVWSAACHPTGLAEAGAVNAHWPGDVRKRLRQLEATEDPRGEDLPVLFFQGFSGDVRPPSGSVKSGPIAALFRRIRLGVTFEPLDWTEYSDWSRAAADQIAAIALECSPSTSTPRLSAVRHEYPAMTFAVGAYDLPPVSFQRVSIGDIQLVGVSAEPVSGYADSLRSLVVDKHVIPIGCIDHVIGYWPTQSMIREGGYEVAGHCRSFGITACDPDIQSKVLQGFTHLLANGDTSQPGSALRSQH